jgi:hypothetical protein
MNMTNRGEIMERDRSKLEELFQGLTPRQVFGLGELSGTYSRVMGSKQAARQAGMAMVRARTAYHQFGQYGDCGPSYTDDYEVAKSRSTNADAAKDEAIRQHKITCQVYLDNGGTQAQIDTMLTIMDELLKG